MMFKSHWTELWQDKHNHQLARKYKFKIFPTYDGLEQTSLLMLIENNQEIDYGCTGFERHQIWNTTPAFLAKDGKTTTVSWLWPIRIGFAGELSWDLWDISPVVP